MTETAHETTTKNSKKTSATDDARWAAVQDREAGERHFVYAVTTTGIYCRVGCPSRQPNRSNVRFFDSAIDAQRAGFRACKRCQPDSHQPQSVQVVMRACQALEAAAGKLSLSELAEQAGYSPPHFQRLFKKVVGVSPKAYSLAIRNDRLRASVQNAKGATVLDEVHEANFPSTSSYYAAIDEALGMSRHVYRNGGAGKSIRYAFATTEYGLALIAVSDDGLCAVELGETQQAMLDSLQRRFRHAKLKRTNDLVKYIEWVQSQLKDDRPDQSLPLDIQGTAFQRQVWERLRRIPKGRTVTYTDLAESLGRPSSVRAVATAVAANPLAVLIPCHRVLRKNGDLGGYRWGLELKKELLAVEQGSR